MVMKEFEHNGELVRVMDELPQFKVAASGNIYGARGGLLKPYITKNGYARYGYTVDYKVKNAYGHRLVATAWLGASAMDVDHLNGERTDNRATNLRFATEVENACNRPCHRDGALPYVSKSKKRFQAIYKGKYIGLYLTPAEAYEAVIKHIESLQ